MAEYTVKHTGSSTAEIVSLGLSLARQANIFMRRQRCQLQRSMATAAAAIMMTVGDEIVQCFALTAQRRRIAISKLASCI